MRIDSAEILHVTVPPSDEQTVAGETNQLHTVLVRLTSGDTFAWGEAPVGKAPCETGEWAAGVFLCLKDWLVPAIVGPSIESGDELQTMLRQFPENHFAKGAID